MFIFGHPRHLIPTAVLCGMCARRSSTRFARSGQRRLFMQNQWFSKVSMPQNHLKSLLKHKLWGPTFWDPDSVGLGRMGEFTFYQVPRLTLLRLVRDHPLGTTCPESLARPHQQMAPSSLSLLRIPLLSCQTFQYSYTLECCPLVFTFCSGKWPQA